MSDNTQSAAWLKAGVGIARTLASSAVWDGGLCAFYGATSPVALGQPPRFRSMGGDVYEGSAGVARFLGWAWVLSGEDALRRTSLGAIRHALSTTEKDWSLFNGGIGIGLVALELAELLDEPELAGLGTSAVEHAGAAAESDGAPFDLLSGIAGMIVGLAAARRYDLDGGWIARAFQLGRRLLACAVSEESRDSKRASFSWPLAPGRDERLCGLAHGASGVALAFETLAQLSPDASGWHRAAQQARAYERGHYSSEAGSWADLRKPETGSSQPSMSYPHMWCHGSIGIVAERLGAMEHDLLARADAVGGLSGIRNHAEQLLSGPVGAGAGETVNGSLCHGLGGVLDVLVDAWKATGDTSWLALGGQVAGLMLNDARRTGGWRSGIIGGWSAPGLMLGNAGMGWALLRMAEPERVPSGWRLGPNPTAYVATGESRIAPSALAAS